MNTRSFIAPPGAARELALCVLAGWAAFIAIPLALGGIGLGWDALNHHVYLGWVAESPRFDRDLSAAQNQAYQYPYLYWPMYKLVQAGVSGRVAGVVLDSLYVPLLPALWVVAHVLVPGRNWEALAMRVLAVALSFLSGVVLAHFDSTGNDLLAAVPFVWSVALALLAWDGARPAWFTPRRLVVLSGLAAGVAVACKLSNGPLALVLPIAWAWAGAGGWRERAANVLWAGAATVAAFLVLYGYWGWQLWEHFGNPVYPMYDGRFAPLRRWLGFPG
jgi:hypothetical protein